MPKVFKIASRRIGLLSVLIGLMLLAGTTAARSAEPASVKACAPPSAADCRYTKGLLWKIERSGRKPSYLFGTIHISDARVTNLPLPVRETFDGAQSFTMEAIANGVGLEHMAEKMFFNDGRTLEGTIGAQRYAEVRRAFAARGLPVEGLEKEKPWVIVMLLSVPAQTGVALDLQLQGRAALQGKPVYGLESMQEQIAVFDELTVADQVALLDDALRSYGEFDRLVETMVQAYLARDLIRILAISESSGPDDRRLRQTVTERLLTNRNARMTERLRPRLEEGNTFIAVGAAHLPGERGLLALLEGAGYRVTPLY